MRRGLAAAPPERVHVTLMLLLTFGTGVTDAVGYLGLDRVFVGNMTGNVVILAMGLVDAGGLPVLGPVLALAGFMAGAALGGRVLRRAGAAWSGSTTVLFGLVALLVLALATTLLVVGAHPVGWLTQLVTTLLASAMGVQAATARSLAVKDVTTVVVTSTITGLAADSVLGSGRGGDTARRVAAVLALLAGAAAGALLLRWHPGAGLVLAGVVAAAVAVVGGLHHRLQPSGTAPVGHSGP